jgi:hypothetical protein
LGVVEVAVVPTIMRALEEVVGGLSQQEAMPLWAEPPMWWWWVREEREERDRRVMQEQIPQDNQEEIQALMLEIAAPLPLVVLEEIGLVLGVVLEEPRRQGARRRLAVAVAVVVLMAGAVEAP